MTVEKNRRNPKLANTYIPNVIDVLKKTKLNIPDIIVNDVIFLESHVPKSGRSGNLLFISTPIFGSHTTIRT